MSKSPKKKKKYDFRNDCSGTENLSRKETSPQDNPNGRAGADMINEVKIVATGW